MSLPSDNLSRRELLRRVGRGAAGAALAALAIALVGRSLRGDCPRDGLCRACPARRDCALPPAIEHRDGENAR